MEINVVLSMDEINLAIKKEIFETSNPLLGRLDLLELHKRIQLALADLVQAKRNRSIGVQVV